VKALPPELNGQVNLTDSAPAAVAGADAVVVGTAWPEFRAQALQIAEAMQGAALLDAGGFLEEALGKADSIRYITVGRARRA
jgi:hypothetical protein